MNNNQMIAVWGSPGSGKTLTSVKISKYLADKKNNVILVLCDDESPSIPILLPSAADDALSIGHLLSLPDMTQKSVLQHCLPFGKSGYISILGYKLGDNVTAYQEYSVSKAKELFSTLRQTADYVVADCSSHLSDNVLTAAALENADKVLKVINADLKSTAYIQSQKQLLQDERFNYKKQINVLNSVLDSQDTYPIREALGGASYILPFLPALKEQFDSGQLLNPLPGRSAKKYESVISNLMEEVLKNEESGIVQRDKKLCDLSTTA